MLQPHNSDHTLIYSSNVFVCVCVWLLAHSQKTKTAKKAKKKKLSFPFSPSMEGLEHKKKSFAHEITNHSPVVNYGIVKVNRYKRLDMRYGWRKPVRKRGRGGLIGLRFSPLRPPLVRRYCIPNKWRLVSHRLRWSSGSKGAGVVFSLRPLAQ